MLGEPEIERRFLEGGRRRNENGGEGGEKT